MEPFQKARITIQKVYSTGDWRLTSDHILEGEELRRFKKSPSPYVQLEEVFDDVAKTAVFIMSLHPPMPNSEKLGDVYFYDVAEALMAMYVVGEFSARYMPIARQLEQRTGKRPSLKKVERLLEEVGILKDDILTGVGQMAAKLLLYSVSRRYSSVESIYLSTLVAHTLFAEMQSFRGSARETLMEAVSRHQRIVNTVKEWLAMSPKLYQREVPLFYEWEDVVKDFALMRIREEGFRFT
jgi:hypothetical protein